MQDLKVGNMLAEAKNSKLDGKQPPDTEDKRMDQVVSKARLLHYSKAMNLLRSPGLARLPVSEVVSKLQNLHPPETVIQIPEGCPQAENFSSSTFDFITGSWTAGSPNRYAPLQLVQL